MRREFRGLDQPLLIATLLLLAVGLLTLYSASLQKSQALGIPYMARQLTWVGLGLALAMRGQAISDFPLCNKSFNLSYCGFDL